MNRVFAEFDQPMRTALGAEHTIPEILGQPDLWLNIWQRLDREQGLLRPFLAEAYENTHRRIVLTGAGSSAFIGELLQGAFISATGRSVQAIPTTDIVTHPEECLGPDVPTLLISFARSGNSPESIAAIERADACLGDLRHLVITCNPEGELAKHPTDNPRAVFTLPEEADDKGLAMTGSFTGMALAGLLLSDVEHLSEAKVRVRRLADAAEQILAQGGTFRRIAQFDFRRAIFLGAGALKGAAREGHLKLQELTNGSVICSYDSFLGFRHGPKAAIDASTLLVYLFSGRDSNRPYEQDLVQEIRGGVSGIFGLGLGSGLNPVGPAEASIPMDALEGLDDAERAICAVLPAQILGVYRSLALGLMPDNPSPSGSISRVVRGVTIYPRVPSVSIHGKGNRHDAPV